MLEKDQSRRGFLQTIGAGALGLLAALSISSGRGYAQEKAVEPKPAEKKSKGKKPAGKKMTEAETMEYVMNNCVCGKCPSWVACDEKGGFCLMGKSKCIKEEKGCICGQCPVEKKLKLKWGYYCTKGDAKSMKKT
ncbi:MAG: DUF2769 domain-containing protein [bacterium]|nr:DUF2769 domain-containing protein [bacterium]